MNESISIAEIKWNFKTNAKKQGSSEGFWYDITDGGYIKPEKILISEEQLTMLKGAIGIVVSFQNALIKADLLEEY